MKTLLFFLLTGLSIQILAQDEIDKLFYSGTDTTGLSKQIAADEKSWTQEDTSKTVDYSAVDGYALKISGNYRNIEDLAGDLTKNFSKDSDKVRAIFRWITKNVSYDWEEYRKQSRNFSEVDVNLSKQKQQEKWNGIYYDYATEVLHKKKGICEGYSLLFYELCKQAGIKCLIVHGKADAGESGKVVWRSHAWNKVLIDGKWYYVDSCWGTLENGNVNNLFYIMPAWTQLQDHVESDTETQRVNHNLGID